MPVIIKSHITGAHRRHLYMMAEARKALRDIRKYTTAALAMAEANDTHRAYGYAEAIQHAAFDLKQIFEKGKGTGYTEGQNKPYFEEKILVQSLMGDIDA